MVLVRMRKLYLTITCALLAFLIAITSVFYFYNFDSTFLMMADGTNACVMIQSPSGGTVIKNDVDISLDYYVPIDFSRIQSFSYDLNGVSNSTIGFIARQTLYSYIDYHISKNLRNLQNADYKVAIYAHYENGTTYLVWHEAFTVNTNWIAPKLTVISPQNQITYDANQIPIIYSMNSKVIWSYYALDTEGEPLNNDWIKFNGNFTLTGLSNGSHKIVISVQSEANRQYGNPISQQIIYFNVC
jgi:hypothetical protein